MSLAKQAASTSAQKRLSEHDANTLSAFRHTIAGHTAAGALLGGSAAALTGRSIPSGAYLGGFAGLMSGSHKGTKDRAPKMKARRALAKAAALINDRVTDLEAASPGASLGLLSRTRVGENVPEDLKISRKKAGKGLKKLRRHSASAGQETKVIPWSIHDSGKLKHTPSGFYSSHPALAG